MRAPRVGSVPTSVGCDPPPCGLLRVVTPDTQPLTVLGVGRAAGRMVDDVADRGVAPRRATSAVTREEEPPQPAVEEPALGVHRHQGAVVRMGEESAYPRTSSTLRQGPITLCSRRIGESRPVSERVVLVRDHPAIASPHSPATGRTAARSRCSRRDHAPRPPAAARRTSRCRRRGPRALEAGRPRGPPALTPRSRGGSGLRPASSWYPS